MADQTTPNNSFILCTIGADFNTWGIYTNQNWATADSALYGVNNAVPTSGININGNLSVNDFSLLDLDYLQFSGNSPLASVDSSIQFDYPNGNCWITDGAGNQILLTLNGKINIASTGGFNGDYTASGSTANATYSATFQTFSFFANVNVPAAIVSGAVSIGQTGATNPNYITIKSPNSLAGAYNLTLPTATPGSLSLLTMSTAGALAFASAASGTLSIGGALSLGTTLTVGTGATVTSGGLTITAGGLTITAGGAAITGTLAITGAATVSTTLAVTSNATVGGTLGVTGNSTFSGTISQTNGGISTTINEGITTQGDIVTDSAVEGAWFQPTSNVGGSTLADLQTFSLGNYVGCFGLISGTSILRGRNIASVSNPSAGTYEIVFSNAWIGSSGYIVACATPYSPGYSIATQQILNDITHYVTGVYVYIENASSAGANDTFSIICY